MRASFLISVASVCKDHKSLGGNGRFLLDFAPARMMQRVGICVFVLDHIHHGAAGHSGHKMHDFLAAERKNTAKEINLVDIVRGDSSGQG